MTTATAAPVVVTNTVSVSDSSTVTVVAILRGEDWISIYNPFLEHRGQRTLVSTTTAWLSAQPSDIRVYLGTNIETRPEPVPAPWREVMSYGYDE